eukprot:TRINITY_DN28400_c0_g1_i3.p1 TRINITY_DN28400_c0_g1~~TRINITY_DN28400_c0_g1_i3.p1  ORF type:complete len:190 (+),score=36.52 TRINITY_DN28400_c0_g1_i3:230-799(+)
MQQQTILQANAELEDDPAALLRAMLSARQKTTYKSSTGLWSPAGHTYLLIESSADSMSWTRDILPCPLPHGTFVVLTCETEQQLHQLESMWMGEGSFASFSLQNPPTVPRISKLTHPAAIACARNAEPSCLLMDALAEYQHFPDSAELFSRCLKLTSPLSYAGLVRASLDQLQDTAGFDSAQALSLIHI